MRITAGWLHGVRQCPTRRYNSRPAGTRISLVVIHCIALPPGVYGGPFVDWAFLGRLDPAAHPYFARVAALSISAHLFVNRRGRITQYVSFLDRAWHAGRSTYAGRPECNDYSVGIELEGGDDDGYEPAQYAALRGILPALARAYPGIGNRIAAHSEVAPGRKTDPGPGFTWAEILNPDGRFRPD